MKTFLVLTSIANSDNPILIELAKGAVKHNIPFIVIGDTKSPENFSLEGCDFYSVERQRSLPWSLINDLPFKHYARKNLGYLNAISKGAEVIIETDDDNIPYSSFWEERSEDMPARLFSDAGWVNVYRYFTDAHIWPRGFALEHIQDNLPPLPGEANAKSPIQQGLADENPDVDAIYRLTLPLPINFNKVDNIALGSHSICPFNSQNTTWFRVTFPLLYLPSYCSFRMTDIWRSFIAQRIAWTCGWNILFHNSTVRQERNTHNLMNDFNDEISGYSNNLLIVDALNQLNLKEGVDQIPQNLLICYDKLIDMRLIDAKEMPLLKAWLKDIEPFL